MPIALFIWMEPMLNLDNFGLKYNSDKIIFEAVNQHIDPNKITLLTGTNGSGKTSLLRVLSGLHKKYSGDISLDGENIRDLSVAEIADKMIYLKQEPQANLVAATPREDLNIWLHKFTESSIDENLILDALKAFEMESMIDTPIWKLSGGQAKRIGLAALLLNKDKFWLLDEPTSGLDGKLQNKLLKILEEKKLNNSGALIVSHRLEIFSELADEIYQIEDRIIK